MLVWDSFLIAFSALLPLINPIGSSLVFLGLVGEAPAETYRKLARTIAINNVIFLAVIELLGSAILHFFGISLPIVQVSGGIVIAIIGWTLLNENDSEATARDKREEIQAGPDASFASLDHKTFYPFTFPVTSGPGTLVVMLTLSARAAGANWTQNMLRHAGLFLAVLVLSAGTYVCYAYAPLITTKISPGTAHGILRVVAFILLCIGVQIAWNGLSVLVPTLLHATTISAPVAIR
jgi:multiple antibiotic resistance protein